MKIQIWSCFHLRSLYEIVNKSYPTKILVEICFKSIFCIMAHIQNSEVLIKEYLAYRGFTNCLKSFESECRSDKNKSFRTDKILESIQTAINSSDLSDLRDIWKNLDTFFFSKLEQNYSESVKKLETGLLKVYLVIAYKNGLTEKISEFFLKMAPEIHSLADWKDWFYFQFCKNAEEHSTFAVYFTKQYQETLFLSLHNFLATIFQSMPLPTVLRTENETSQIRKLQEENTKLRQKLQAAHQPGSSHQHQSRQQMFLEKKNRPISSPSEIFPFDIAPPPHLVDDFFIIAQESLNLSETQSRGFKSLIRNISSGTSPVGGRKEILSEGSKNKRSGSVGSQRSSWMNRD